MCLRMCLKLVGARDDGRAANSDLARGLAARNTLVDQLLQWIRHAQLLQDRSHNIFVYRRRKDLRDTRTQKRAARQAAGL